MWCFLEICAYMCGIRIRTHTYKLVGTSTPARGDGAERGDRSKGSFVLGGPAYLGKRKGARAKRRQIWPQSLCTYRRHSEFPSWPPRHRNRVTAKTVGKYFIRDVIQSCPRHRANAFVTARGMPINIHSPVNVHVARFARPKRALGKHAPHKSYTRSSFFEFRPPVDVLRCCLLQVFARVRFMRSSGRTSNFDERWNNVKNSAFWVFFSYLRKFWNERFFRCWRFW